MKKLLIIIVLFLSVNMFGQNGAAAIKLGSFNPGATDAGFIIGYEGGKFVDHNFNFGWGIDWFHINYVDRALASSFNEVYGLQGDINELRAKTNLHDIPLMVNVTVKHFVAPRTKIYATGGIGAELLIIDYRNFENPDNSELKAAFDFNWRVGFGAAYNIGPRSEILVELTYHNSEPSWTYEVDVPPFGKRTFERVYDMSGLMIRAGFRFYY
ncbi:outer membrane protein [Bacteroidota bacterium]